MRKRIQLAILGLLLVLLNAGLPVAQAQPENALRRMLERVPDNQAIRSQLISYLDFEALVNAREGAAHPRSLAEWNALDQDSNEAGLYRAVLMGVGAGMSEILQNFFKAPEMFASTGLDIFTIDRMLTGSQPPSMLNVLEGSFDPAVIGNAFGKRDYTTMTVGDYSVLCPAAGCETGMQLDLKNRDVTNPFGGRLGRSEPLAVNDQAILNSPDYQMLESALNVQDNVDDSIAANDNYLSAVNTAGEVGTVMQAYFIPSLLVSEYSVYLVPQMTKEQIEEAHETLRKTWKSIPAYSLVMFAHVDRGEDQAVIVSLVYDREDDAKIAAEELPKRIAAYQSIRVRQPFLKLIEERGGTIETPTVVSDVETGKFVVVTQIGVPYEPSEPNDDMIVGKFRASGMLFRLFYDALVSRDTGWLITQIPELQ